MCAAVHAYFGCSLVSGDGGGVGVTMRTPNECSEYVHTMYIIYSMCVCGAFGCMCVVQRMLNS